MNKSLTPTSSPGGSFTEMPYVNNALFSSNLFIGISYISSDRSITPLIPNLSVPDVEPLPFLYCQSSGVLSFWNDPEEDIYTFKDGKAV